MNPKFLPRPLQRKREIIGCRRRRDNIIIISSSPISDGDVDHHQNHVPCEEKAKDQIQMVGPLFPPRNSAFVLLDRHFPFSLHRRDGVYSSRVPTETFLFSLVEIPASNLPPISTNEEGSSPFALFPLDSELSFRSSILLWGKQSFDFV